MFCPNTKKELKKAIKLWCQDKDAVLEKYGDITPVLK